MPCQLRVKRRREEVKIPSRSRSRGTASATSDIDLLIVCDPLPDGQRPRVAQFLRLEDRLREREPRFAKMMLSPVIKTPVELQRGSPLLWDMTEEVLILVDRDRLLERCLRHACEVARSLAKEREQAFDGEDDTIPTEFYSHEQADRAIEEARCVVDLCRTLVAPPS